MIGGATQEWVGAEIGGATQEEAAAFRVNKEETSSKEAMEIGGTANSVVITTQKIRIVAVVPNVTAARAAAVTTTTTSGIN